MSADTSRLALCRKALDAIEAIRERMEGLGEALNALKLPLDQTEPWMKLGRTLECAEHDFNRIENAIRQELASVERRAVVLTAAREG